MKSVLTKMAVLFVLLIALTFVVSGTASAQSVTAIHKTTATQTQVVNPNINRVSCGSRTDWFRMWTDYDWDIDCFANAGSISVSIYNADYVCSGNNAGVVYWYYGGFYGSTYYPKWTCGDIYLGNYVYVYYITIY